MYGFPIVAVPLTYLAVAAWFFPHFREERLTQSFGKGLLLALPCLLIHSLAFRFIPELPGSVLFLFRIWWERFFLPLGLGIAAHRLLYTFGETVRSASSLRRFAAFLFGYLTIFNAAFSIRAFGLPGPFTLYFFPILFIAAIFATLFFVERIATETGIRIALWIAAAALASFAFAGASLLFQARLEWLGGILSLVILGASVYLKRDILK